MLKFIGKDPERFNFNLYFLKAFASVAVILFHSGRSLKSYKVKIAESGKLSDSLMELDREIRCDSLANDTDDKDGSSPLNILTISLLSFCSLPDNYVDFLVSVTIERKKHVFMSPALKKEIMRLLW
jgi:hypothetical protein